MSDIELLPTGFTNPLVEFRLLKAESELLDQQKHIKELEEMIRENRTFYERKMQEMTSYYEAQERSRLKWGISTLGTLVTILIGVVWNYRSVIFK
jgi:hypothetical protein